MKPYNVAPPPRMAPRSGPGPTVAGAVANSPSTRPRADTGPRTPDISHKLAPPARPSPRHLSSAPGSRPRSAAGSEIPLSTSTIYSSTQRTIRPQGLSERPLSRDRPNSYYHVADLRRPESISRAAGRRLGPGRVGQDEGRVPASSMGGSPSVASPNGNFIRARPKGPTSSSLHVMSPPEQLSRNRSPSPGKDREREAAAGTPVGFAIGGGMTMASAPTRRSIGSVSQAGRSQPLRAPETSHNPRQPSVDSVATVNTSLSTSSGDSRVRPGLGTLFAPPQSQHPQPSPQHTRQPSTDASAITSASPAPSAPILVPASSSPQSKAVFFAPAQSSPQRSFLTAASDESVNEARRQRQILDLEISNSSLLAINRQLEKEVRKQRSELRRFRRLTRAGRLSDFSAATNSEDAVGDISAFGGLASVPEDRRLGSDSLPRDPSALGLVDPSELSDSDEGLSPTVSSSRLINDEKELRSDIEKHRQLLVDNQKLGQSLTKCFLKTEELIIMGKEALAYQVSAKDVPLTGKLGAAVSAADDIDDTDAEMDHLDDDDLDGTDDLDEPESVADTIDTYASFTDTDGHEEDPYAGSDGSDDDRGRPRSTEPLLPPAPRMYVPPRLPSPKTPPRKSSAVPDPDATATATAAAVNGTASPSRAKENVADALSTIRMWTNGSPQRPSRIVPPRFHSPSPQRPRSQIRSGSPVRRLGANVAVGNGAAG